MRRTARVRFDGETFEVDVDLSVLALDDYVVEAARQRAIETQDVDVDAFRWGEVVS